MSVMLEGLSLDRANSPDIDGLCQDDEVEGDEVFVLRQRAQALSDVTSSQLCRHRPVLVVQRAHVIASRMSHRDRNPYISDPSRRFIEREKPAKSSGYTDIGIFRDYSYDTPSAKTSHLLEGLVCYKETTLLSKATSGGLALVSLLESPPPATELTVSHAICLRHSVLAQMGGNAVIFQHMSVNRSDISHYLLHLVTIWGNMTGSMQPGHAPISRVNQVRDSGKGHQVLSTSSSKLQPIRGTRATRSTDAAGSEGLPIGVSDDEDDDPPTKRQRTTRSAYSKPSLSSTAQQDSANNEDIDPSIQHTDIGGSCHDDETEDDEVETVHEKRVVRPAHKPKHLSHDLLSTNDTHDTATVADDDGSEEDRENEAGEPDVSPSISTSHGIEDEDALIISIENSEDF
ncbi:uncharacterized protein MYCGRDRAFT_92082 [Zymoseptoria tritici IPO323]|uniref:Uncharacterized protein n=1 Tax=Zymoseptoria tritici (strain CBS 115943 / IPO323) TaxID=336722 RepID=F9X6H4_ZYMTI|nr:uncharacterized protein MYCGRDRAFT_92082 [Zymoseptoria tritici IPO323]EGP89197.1 hypothetical protein MYCGRDRAFT_92082 [Zymoseptoria tritici IPO323]